MIIEQTSVLTLDSNPHVFSPGNLSNSMRKMRKMYAQAIYYKMSL